MDQRHDFRPSPPIDRYGAPGLSFPTPNVRDFILTEDVPLRSASFAAVEYGQPHPQYPAARLVFQAPVKGNGTDVTVRRIYATTRNGQDAWNATFNDSGDDPDFPIFIRRYTLPRAGYTEATIRAPLTAVIGIVLTGAGTGYTVTAPPTVTISGGGGSGATAEAQVAPDGTIGAVLLTNSGTGYTSAPTVAFSTGAATATAIVQPQTAVLVSETAHPAADELASLFLDVERTYETLPGPWLPFVRYDHDLGPVQGQRRAVLNTGQTADLSATGTTKYESRDGSAIVSFETQEEWGSGGSPAYPSYDEDGYDDERGAFKRTSQQVTKTGSETGSLTLSGSTLTRITYEDGVDQFHLRKVIDVSTLPGPVRGGAEENPDTHIYRVETLQLVDRALYPNGAPVQPGRYGTLTPGNEDTATLRYVSWQTASAFSGQFATGWRLTYADDSASYPTYTHTLCFLRSAFVPATRESVLDSLLAIKVTAGGSGYTSAPTVTVSGNATAIAVVSGGAVVGVYLTNCGTGYTFAGSDTVSFSGGGGSGATATTVKQPATCILVSENEVDAEGAFSDRFVTVRRVYKTIPGPVTYEFEAEKYGTMRRTSRQEVLSGTSPNTTGTSLIQDRVQDESTVLAERTIVQQTASDGTVLGAGLIVTLPERSDPETGVVIFTDSFPATLTTALPPTYTVDNLTAYGQWFQPNAGRTAYSTTPYSPPRYVIDARKVDENTPNCRIEVEYCRIPSVRVEDDKQGCRWPAIFDVAKNLTIPENYGGKYPPPWPIGANQIGGFSYLAHRQTIQPVRVIYSYTVGRSDALPASLLVRSPGAGSKIFQIPEDCIHPALNFGETVTVEGNPVQQPVEEFPASTPSFYDPLGIYVLSAREIRWKGEIYVTEVVIASESRPLSAFPDPTSVGYYWKGKDFTLTGDVPILTPSASRRVYATTPSITVTDVDVYGQDAVTGESGTVDTVATGGAASDTVFKRVTEIRLESVAEFDVTISPAVQPDTATLLVTALPSDGDTLVVGLSGSERTYTFKTTLDTTPDEIHIADGLVNQAAYIIDAIGGVAHIGSAFSTGTDRHADVLAEASTNPRLIVFSSSSPTTNTDPSGWTLSITGTWGTPSDWVEGETSPPMAVIPAGKTLAFNPRALSNPVLLDDGATNDAQAQVNLPSAPFLLSDTMTGLPPAKTINLLYSALGRQGLRVWWQEAGTTSTFTLTLTGGSATFSSTPALPSDMAFGFDAIAIDGGDPVVLTDATTIAANWGGADGTFTGIITSISHRLPNALSAQLNDIQIGTIASGNLAVLIGAVPPYTDRAVAFRAQWIVTPDD